MESDDYQRLRSEANSSVSGPENMSEEGGETEEEDTPESFAVEVEPVRPAAVRLDAVRLPEWLKKRPSVMKSVPFCVKGPFRNALRLALEEAVSEEGLRKERGWKLLLLLPRMLLFRQVQCVLEKRMAHAVGRQSSVRRASCGGTKEAQAPR